MNRGGGAVWLQRACLETALALVSSFLGRSRPWETFPRTPRHRGCSVVSSRSNMYAAGSREAEWIDCPLPGGIIAYLFEFCKEGVAAGPTWTDGLVAACALFQRMALLRPALSLREGWLWRAPLSRPLRPPTFLETWGHADPRREPRLPAPSFGRWVRLSLSIAGDALRPRRGLHPLTPAWRTGG